MKHDDGIQGQMQFDDYYTCTWDECPEFHGKCDTNHQKCNNKHDIFHLCQNHQNCASQKVFPYEYGKQHKSKKNNEFHKWLSLADFQEQLTDENESKKILFDDRIKSNLDVEKIIKEFQQLSKNLTAKISSEFDQLIEKLRKIKQNEENYRILMEIKDEKPFEKYHQYLRKFINTKPEHINEFKLENEQLRNIKETYKQVDELSNKFLKDLSLLSKCRKSPHPQQNNESEKNIIENPKKIKSAQDEQQNTSLKYQDVSSENNSIRNTKVQNILNEIKSEDDTIYSLNHDLFGLIQSECTQNKSKEIQKILQTVSKLNIDLSSNKIINIDPLKSLGSLTGLTQLNIKLWNNQIINIDPLKSLGSLTGLTELWINLENNQIINIDPLKSLGSLTGLTQLRINLEGNQIINFDPLQSLANLHKLTKIEISLNNQTFFYKVKLLEYLSKMN